MTRYSLVTQRTHIAAAQHLLANRLAREADLPRTYTIGFPSGDLRAAVRYLPDIDLWYALKKLHNRYWNGFGFSDPSESRKALTLTVEINPSFTGSRRCAGLFFRDARGRLYLGHTGRIGGGRAGVGKLKFLAEVKDLLVPVEDSEDLLIGRIDAENFTRKLADFASSVRDFKTEVAASANLPDAATQDARVPAKARLRKYGGNGESDEHKQLKLYVADNPEILRLGEVSKAHVEYSYVTGDRVDVMLELANGTHVVVEVERRGERPTMIGAHQAIKYRALMAAELRVHLHQVRAILVACHIPRNTREFCEQQRVRVHEVRLAFDTGR